ncbi:MAG TPA: hypothetical protein VE379_05355 [Vicinamibacterales bacterium]|jgi:hypothetical protein|nr:hypothetical protein [Vicinamibacterales bacterium]
MPLLVLVVGMVALLGVIVILMPVSLIQRYRVGTARRAARGWVTTLNLVAIAISTALFLAGAAVTNVWVPDALKYAAAGLLAGCVLGVAGLAASRWEASRGALHYTPNRWLVLAITLTVTGRILYGFWRSYQAWQSGLSGSSWFVAAGVAGSLAAGALVLGYYLVYWAGVRRRLNEHRRIMGGPRGGRSRD